LLHAHEADNIAVLQNAVETFCCVSLYYSHY